MSESEFCKLFVIESNTHEETEETYKWTYNNTLLFLDLYKQYRKNVGTLRLKNLKKMYEEIAKKLQLNTNTNISPSNCENRWRVLERAYKRYVDNNNKTGRGRKEFEYATIMDEILGHKRNITPVLLLSSDTAHNIEEKENTEPVESEAASSSITKAPSQQSSKAHTTNNSKKLYRNKRLKLDLMEQIRNDRKDYYKKRLAIAEKELDEHIKSNELMEERNEILRELSKKNELSYVDLD